MKRTWIISYALFFIFVFFNFLLWKQSNHLQAQWLSVPEVPTVAQASMRSLGDKQLAYRVNALNLQNFGEIGGQETLMRDYDFVRLQKWFFLQDALDPRSDVVPMLAAYYYGAVKDKEKLDYVLDYLAVVGQRPDGNKWRWLGHGVYLARHVQKDNERALELAYLLAENKNPDLADWAKQMPALILHKQGENELAYKIILNLLISNVDTLHPNEINYMRDYICNTLLKELPHIFPPPFCREIE